MHPLSPGRCLVVGEAVVDIVVDQHGGRRQRPGGSPLNVAVALSRLGVPVSLLTAWGRDAGGGLLAGFVAASGVAVALAEPAVATSTALARLDERGEATYTFDLRWPPPPPLPAAPRTAPAWIHHGSLGALLAPGAAGVARLVAGRGPGTAVSYDPNVRPLLTPHREEVRAAVEARCAASHLVKLSEEDARFLYPGRGPDDLAAGLLALGPAAVVLTRGAEGALGWTRDGAVRTPPATTPGPVVDTVGAGDAFLGGLVAALWPGDDLAAGRVAPDRLGRAMAVAADVAARTCCRAGADPPWRAELPGLLLPV